MNDTEKHFIGLLAKANLTADEFTKRETARNTGLAMMRAELDAMVMTPDGRQVPLRDSIREGMTFQLVDKKGKKHEKSFSKDGQEHAADSEASTAKGHGLSADDQARVQKAMDDALKLVDKLRAQQGPDGKPLYDDGDLMEEVFTPLVREGLLPDNLVIDKYSATNQLLSATFGRYNKAMQDAEKAKQAKKDLAVVDATGKVGAVKELGGKALAIKEEMQAKMFSNLGLSEDSVRRIQLGAGIAGSVASYVKSNKSSLGELVPDFMVNDVKEHLDVIGQHLETAKDALDADLQKHAPFVVKPVEAVEKAVEGIIVRKPETTNDAPKPSEFKKILQEVQASYAMALFDYCAKEAKTKIVDEVEQAKWLQEVSNVLGTMVRVVKIEVESIPHFDQMEAFAEAHGKEFRKMCLGGIVGLGTTGVSAIKQGVIDIKPINDGLAEADRLKRIGSAVREVVREIDAALTKAVSAVDSVAGVALSGQFVKRVRVSEAGSAAAENPADGKTVISLFAAGIEDTFANGAPPPADPPDGTAEVFAKMGAAVAAGFRAKANANQLSVGLKGEPAAAFGELVKAVQAAATKELGTLAGIDDPTDAGTASEFKKRVKTPANQKGMLAQGALPDPEDAQDELQKSDAELKSYEDSLLLLDEGGMDAAQARSIETLILELQKNRKVLELVSGLGQGLIGAGISALKPVSDTGLGGHATDVLKIAKLIVQLAVNTKKAADRWILWYKFRSSLGHSKKAVSALTSTIQGFFNNKKEQIAFHTIDDALTAVQIAFTIIGMVPEPITMGIGKTVNLAATAAQLANQVAGKIYNEVMLSKAWSTTLAAINNPANRTLGLAALRLNPTLGMHAVAWAGAEKRPPDAIAQMLIRRLGVSAQAIAAGASGDSVKQYLTELLNEDRQIERDTGVNLDWLPSKFTLSARDFFVITNRAAEKAKPKLRLAGEKRVIEVLKALDDHDLDKLAPLANRGDVAPEEMATLVGGAEAVRDALMSYDPRCEDGTAHDEMGSVQAEFLSKAATHLNRLETLQAQNALARTQAIDALKAELKTVASLPADADATALTSRIDASSAVLNDIAGRSVLASDPDMKALVDQLGSSLDELRDRAA